MRIEKIVWLDSGMSINEGWQPLQHLMRNWRLTDMNVVSVGITSYEDEDVVGLCHSHSRADDAYTGLVIIAKKNIISREVLNELD